MASQISQQYAYRAQKSLGLVNGTPEYAAVAGFVGPDVPARTHSYSADGRLYAYALPTAVRIYQAEGAQLLQELPLSNIVEISFSPRGTYLSTWERPVKLEDGGQHKNLRIFSVSTAEELISFTQKSQDGWELQYTISESHAIRLVSGEIQVFRPAEWSKGIADKLKVEGATSVSLSPGLNPSIAVFVAEKKGAPASIKIYGLNTLGSPPTCQKTFFKADRAQIKWNTLGTQVLLLTQTEVDNSNKSYYGETGMYLLSAAGNFDCRVTLDKDGPIHDFSWSPNSKEFAVVYGYTPAKTMIFDQRVRTLHDFGAGTHNFISFNPQGRLIALAGFGNLAGKIDMIDRRTLAKVCVIDAPNTSYCEWSPDGRFLLTATLSPRLRVDNCIKIWHCTGPLMHIQLTEELYQTAWRPTPVENVPQFGQAIPPAPAPSESVQALAAVQKPTPSKPAGAYRPPGARGLATPAMFKREDEGGPMSNGGASGSATPPRYNRSPVPGAPGYGQHPQQVNGNGYHQHPNGGRRQVPGAPPPSGSPSPGPDGAKGARKKKAKKDNVPNNGGGGGTGASTPGEEVVDVVFGNVNVNAQPPQGPHQGQGRRQDRDYRQDRDHRQEREPRQDRDYRQEREPRQERDHRQEREPRHDRGEQGNGNRNGGGGRRQNGPGNVMNMPPPVIVSPPAPEAEAAQTPVTPGGIDSMDPAAKKARNLNKKLKAIEELKEKAKRGERLEATQLRKMDGEAEIRKELAGLGL